MGGGPIFKTGSGFLHFTRHDPTRVSIYANSLNPFNSFMGELA